MTSSTLLQRARGIDASTLSDANKQLRVLPPAIAPVGRGAHLAGRAVTADAGDSLASVIAALTQAGEGDVLVIGHCTALAAYSGELFASEALRRGMAGIVIDGFCRDTSVVANIDLPVYARGATPCAPPLEGAPRIQVPITIGHVAVNPGDILVGDDDGIVVASEAELEAAIDRAEEIQAREDRLRAAIEEGQPLFGEGGLPLFSEG
jgi:regulator of RNase E activity RraA